jgi:translation initiation factor 1A
MPRNIKGGKKYKKGKKNTNEQEQDIVKDIYKINGIDQYYGVVEKRLGGLYLSVELLYKKNQKQLDNSTVIAHIRGRFRKRVFFNPGDVLLLSSRSTNDNKMDTLYKYNHAEIQQLKNEGEINKKYWSKLNSKINEEEDELDFNISFQEKDKKIITEYKSNQELIPASSTEDELTEDEYST